MLCVVVGKLPFDNLRSGLYCNERLTFTNELDFNKSLLLLLVIDLECMYELIENNFKYALSLLWNNSFSNIVLQLVISLF
jgi:hypothetical protein